MSDKVTEASEPVFRLPPFTIEQVFTAMAETVDWGLQVLKVPDCWPLSRGKGVKVAVLDTGATPGHPDLRDAIVAAKDFTGSPSGSADRQGHSTHCCGIIAARQNNSGVVGVAPEASLYVGKVLGDNGSGTMSSIVNGIRWAISQNVDIISMSLGSPQGSPSLEKAIEDAVAAGILVCCAAGNEGPDPNTVGFPAQYAGVISIGSINRSMQISNFSSRGRRVDVAAPGEQILSCFPPNRVAVLSGTSMATPFVAGVAAVLAGYDRSAVKDTAAFLALIKKFAYDAGPTGWDQSFGWGIIEPPGMLNEIKKRPTQPPPAGGDDTVTLIGDDLTSSGLAKVSNLLGGVFPGSVTLKKA